jgi:hypothetical protein
MVRAWDSACKTRAYLSAVVHTCVCSEAPTYPRDGMVQGRRAVQELQAHMQLCPVLRTGSS